uniref:Uncharacterized protein n=1 Tax=Rhodnius prolixus TaxID=13249 RepID=T1HIU1_RHOPR
MLELFYGRVLSFEILFGLGPLFGDWLGFIGLELRRSLGLGVQHKTSRMGLSALGSGVVGEGSLQRVMPQPPGLH